VKGAALLGWLGWWVCAAAAAAQTGSSAEAPVTKLPAGALLVKGAWSSATDSTPMPEAGKVADRYYTNEYFRLRYPLPANWTQQYEGPPPSDSGYYVLAQILPASPADPASRGTILITAQDLFFTPGPANNAREFVQDVADHLSSAYVVEQPPSQLKIQGRSFVQFGYASPGIGLHWRILATEARCHIVQFVFTTRDRGLTERLLSDFRNISLTSADTPVCVRGYASATNLVEKVDRALLEHPFNPIPVRVTIDERGSVKHIHFLSAFASDARTITDAVMQWRFKPYRVDGHPVEVETGIVFGRELHVTAEGSRPAPD
jgi:hypothetical protein